MVTDNDNINGNYVTVFFFFPAVADIVEICTLYDIVRDVLWRYFFSIDITFS